MSSIRYFLYIQNSNTRNSRNVTVDTKQLAELTAFATRYHLTIGDVIVDTRDQNRVNGPKFYEMLERIKRKEARGILAWSPHDLTQHLLDAAPLIRLIDTRCIKSLKFLTLGPHTRTRTKERGRN